MQIEPGNIKNILVLRNDRFGEFLLNIPALRALRQTFTDARIIAAVDPYVSELAQGIPFIDQVIEWRREERPLSEKLSLIRFLKKSNIDIAVMLNPSRDFNILTYLAGIPIRVGYDRKCGFLLTHKMKDEKYLGLKHEIEYNLELVGLIGARAKDKTLSLAIDDIDNNLLEQFNIKAGDKLFAVHPWTSDSLKQWPLDNFVQLSGRLIKELNTRVLLCGGRDEAPRSTELFGNFDNYLINITGKTTLKQLAMFLKRCSLLISGDSGPMHLACAVGTPVLAIFRSDLPEKSARRWGPWGEGNVVIENESLADISVEEVMNKIKEVVRYT